jgi:hypothetical protein
LRDLILHLTTLFEHHPDGGQDMPIAPSGSFTIFVLIRKFNHFMARHKGDRSTMGAVLILSIFAGIGQPPEAKFDTPAKTGAASRGRQSDGEVVGIRIDDFRDI